MNKTIININKKTCGCVEESKTWKDKENKDIFITQTRLITECKGCKEIKEAKNKRIDDLNTWGSEKHKLIYDIIIDLMDDNEVDLDITTLEKIKEKAHYIYTITN